MLSQKFDPIVQNFIQSDFSLCLGIVLISVICVNNITFSTMSSMQGFIADIGEKFLADEP